MDEYGKHYKWFRNPDLERKNIPCFLSYGKIGFNVLFACAYAYISVCICVYTYMYVCIGVWVWVWIQVIIRKKTIRGARGFIKGKGRMVTEYIWYENA